MFGSGWRHLFRLPPPYLRGGSLLFVVLKKLQLHPPSLLHHYVFFPHIVVKRKREKKKVLHWLWYHSPRAPADTFFRSLPHPERKIGNSSCCCCFLFAVAYSHISVLKVSWPLRSHCGPSALRSAWMVNRTGCWGSVGPPELPSWQGSDLGSARQLPSHPPRLPPLSVPLSVGGKWREREKEWMRTEDGYCAGLPVPGGLWSLGVSSYVDKHSFAHNSHWAIQERNHVFSYRVKWYAAVKCPKLN